MTEIDYSRSGSRPVTSTGRPDCARPDRLLRLALRVDAAVTGLNGVGYLAAAPVLDGLLGLPAGMLAGTGVFLLAFAAAVWLVARRPTLRLDEVDAVVIGNLLWVAASTTAAITGWGTPTAVGTGWIVLQAAVVAAFAVWQGAGRYARSRC